MDAKIVEFNSDQFLHCRVNWSDYNHVALIYLKRYFSKAHHLCWWFCRHVIWRHVVCSMHLRVCQYLTFYTCISLHALASDNNLKKRMFTNNCIRLAWFKLIYWNKVEWNWWYGDVSSVLTRRNFSFRIERHFVVVIGRRKPLVSRFESGFSYEVDLTIKLSHNASHNSNEDT